MSAMLPPHDLDAEKALLGLVLADSSCDFDTLAKMPPEAMYSEAHSRSWKAFRDIVQAGRVPDMVQLRAQIRKNGDSSVVDENILRSFLPEEAGFSYGQATEYARIITDAAKKRALIAALHKSLAIGMAGELDAEEFIRRTQGEIEAASKLEASEFSPRFVQDVIKEDLAELARSGNVEEPIAVCGVEAIDKTIRVCEGHLVFIGARPGMGKAQSVDEMIMTPHGPRRMGDLVVGDLVTGASGKPTRVTNVFERGRLDLFRVTFDDGTFTSCCDDHLWLTRTRADRRKGARGSVRSTRDIRATVSRSGGGRNHSIPYCGAVEFNDGEQLTVPAYLLGAWLGDGSAATNTVRFHNSEEDVKAMFVDCLSVNDTTTLRARCTGTHGDTLTVRRVKKTNAPSHLSIALGSLGLLGTKSHTKFIPAAYLWSSVPDRVALLRGLLDTNGHVDETGTSVEYATASQALADGVVELVRGLGGSVSMTTRGSAYTVDGISRACRPSHRLRITFPTGNIVPVSSEKHIAKWRTGRSRVAERFIVSVEPAGSAICRCISVDADDHLYVTAQGIVTHNSSLAEHYATATGDALFCSLEMPGREYGRRTMAHASGVPFLRAVARMGEFGPRFSAGFDSIRKRNIIVVDQPSITLAELRAHIREARRMLAEKGRKLKLVVVDYLQLMSSTSQRKGGTRSEEVGALTKALKDIAKREKIAIIVLAQLNRAAEKDDRPTIAHLRESGDCEQDADKVILLYRQNYYDKKDLGDVEPAEIIVGKDRQGRPGVVHAGWRGEVTSFVDIETEEYA